MHHLAVRRHVVAAPHGACGFVSGAIWLQNMELCDKKAA
jgi:hypothetical protein